MEYDVADINEMEINRSEKDSKKMKTLETGDDKIKKICDALRNETLEPAQKKGAQIVEEAKDEAEKIIREANNKAEKLIEDARKKMEQERVVLNSSMQQAVRQSLESLRQEIENSLFNKELENLLVDQIKEPEVVSKLITAMLDAIKKEGLSADFSALIPKSVSIEKVNQALGSAVVSQLRKKSVSLGSFGGGAQVKLHDKNITIDITEKSLKELLARNVRKDFREMVFAS